MCPADCTDGERLDVAWWAEVDVAMNINSELSTEWKRTHYLLISSGGNIPLSCVLSPFAICSFISRL